MAAAALLGAASIALFWPGYALYDTVAQYTQATTREFDDWHPPVMARLWSLLVPLGGGAAPMLVLQLALYWCGAGLIAGGLHMAGRPRAGWGVLALAALPLFLGWQGVVLKDAQLIGATLAAVGLVAWWRLQGQRVPIGAVVLASVLLGYAMLVRANAVFALAPLTAGLLPLRRTATRVLVTAALTLAVLAAAGPIDHDLLGAESTGVEATQPIYDLAGIAVRAGAVPPIGAAMVAALRTRRCVTPFFWDPLGDPAACNDVIAPLQEMPAGSLYRALAGAVLAHPLAYATQRAAHWNATERWLVPAPLPGAAPPAANEPNAAGLRAPGAAAATWQRIAGLIATTPLGWPIAWLAGALLVAVAARRSPVTPTRELALALLASALCLEASFLVVSIAADLRYHLWPMLATGLAAILVAPRRLPRAGAAAVLGVVAAGVAARATLPAAPPTYRAMLMWRGLPGTPRG